MIKQSNGKVGSAALEKQLALNNPAITQSKAQEIQKIIASLRAREDLHRAARLFTAMGKSAAYRVEIHNAQ